MDNNFKLEICSDLEYEGMIVDILYKNDLIATLNQDMGMENIVIKLFQIQNEFLNFSYKDFLEILEKAKKLLIEINKTSH